MPSRARALTFLVGLTVVAGFLADRSTEPTPPPERPDLDVVAASAVAEHEEPSEPSLPDGWTVERHSEPERADVLDEQGVWVATFTDGASTVAVAGPERRFDEESATDGVTTSTWVRLLDEPFDGELDPAWLDAALEDTSPDVLEVLTEYWEGAPEVVDEDGVVIAGEAGYGPLQDDGDRPVGSDWHDYLGVEGAYPDHRDPPDPEEYRMLDCSGYVRLVYGVRLGLELSYREGDGSQIPRRSMQQAAKAPGVVPIEDEGGQVPAEHLDRLQAGDLVFFDAPSDDDGEIDHVGVYLGVDDAGHHRFVHSRRSVNGPTMGGDDTSASVLDGDGFYGEGFRASRRL